MRCVGCRVCRFAPQDTAVLVTFEDHGPELGFPLRSEVRSVRPFLLVCTWIERFPRDLVNIGGRLTLPSAYPVLFPLLENDCVRAPVEFATPFLDEVFIGRLIVVND